MRDLYRHWDDLSPHEPVEDSIWSDSDGWLVPVEPETVVTTDGNAPVFVGLDAGTYVIVRLEDNDE